MKRKLFGILIIIWMVTIFIFSSEDGDKSNNTSDKITKRVVNTTISKEENNVIQENENITPEETKEIEKKQAIQYEEKRDETSFYVRKTAHFTIYLIGGVLLFNFIHTFSDNKIKCIIIAILCAGAYAASDEFHQYFVAERSAELRDVLLDTAGATVRSSNQ